MPTTTAAHGIVIPTAGTEPADLYGVATRLGNSVEDALTRPYVQLAASAATTMTPANTATKILLATTVHIDSTHFSVASSVVTVLVTGLYDIHGWMATNGVASRVVVGYGKNGTSTFYATTGDGISTAEFSGSTVDLGVPLTAGDTIQLIGYTGNASQATAHSSPTQVSRLTVRKVG